MGFALSGLGLYACSAAAGASAPLAPFAANLLLARKREAFSRHHEQMARGARAYFDEYGRWPDRGLAGDEGAWGVWYEHAAASAEAGTLSGLAAEAADRHGIALPGDARLEAAPAAYRCELRTGAAWALLAVLAGAVALACARGWGAADAVWLIAGTACMAVMVICDGSARIIPWEACAAFAAAGVAHAAAIWGWRSVLAAAGAAVAAWLAVWLAGAVAGRGRKVPAIGSGDRRAAASTVLYLGIPAGSQALSAPVAAGLAASCALTLAVLAAALAAGRIARGQYLPFAPFFALWGFAGVIATAAGPFALQ